jgi:decaprenylphospho-beta-D-erythro-pentofuranosid-2-ulose 2-reductase
MKNVMIIGATSGIARSCAYQFAANGSNLVLAGRNIQELEKIAGDIRIRFNVNIIVKKFEAFDYDTHEVFFQSASEDIGSLDGIIVAHGYLGDQQEAQSNWGEAQKIIETNYTSAVSIFNMAANYFEQKQSGFICGISSVAGDRGRQSNYMYGSAKGGLSVYLQGLRNRLSKSNVHVLTVKPGFVDTKMTYGQEGMFLVAQPEDVAFQLYKALRGKRNIAYLPWFWKYIMFVIKSVPEPIFKRMKL